MRVQVEGYALAAVEANGETHTAMFTDMSDTVHATFSDGEVFESQAYHFGDFARDYGISYTIQRVTVEVEVTLDA